MEENMKYDTGVGGDIGLKGIVQRKLIGDGF
jgi:hypothetical protein